MAAGKDKVKRRSRLSSLLQEKSAEFFRRSVSSDNLITVTRVKLSSDLKQAKVLVTIYPEDQGQVTIIQLRRSRSDLTGYLKKQTRLGSIPYLDIDLDAGEKERQRIDRLSQNL